MALSPVVESSGLVEQVRAYRQDVLHHRVRPEWGQCPLCRAPAHDGQAFRRHEARRRWFWVVVGLVVQRFLSLITRWKCVHCQRAFTLYPAFALPYKRYVLPCLLDRAQGYVDDDGQSYRRAVKTKDRPVFHEPDEGAEITAESSEEDKKREPLVALAHSTLYRWVTTLGQLPNTVRHASELIRQRDPGTGLFRECAGLAIHPGKYRSGARRGILQTGWGLAHTEAVYASLFGISLFPNLATVCGFT